jgi:hypothetical protein
MQTYERFDMVKSLVPDCTYRVDFGMSRIKEFIEQYEVDMDPAYQRDYVWDINQKQKFVGALLQNPNSIPIFWFNWKSKRHTDGSEVVDGKQRMNALLEWGQGKFEAICPCEERFHVDQLDEISKRYVNYSCTCKMHFVCLSPIEVMRFYLALNSGGTIHSSEDLAKVRLAIVETNLKNKGKS